MNNEAKKFLELLDPAGRFTFQTFDDNKERATAYKNENKGTGDPQYTRVLHGTFEEHEAELNKLNKRGAGVFVTVNETDGKGRTGKNITRIRALFIDLDGAPVEPVLEDTAIRPPHIVVESSPGRWHCYWRVKGMKLEDFGEAQKAMIARYGSDKTIHDLPRVLRLPGFVHQKGAPFTSLVISSRDDLPYEADKFLAELPRAKKGKGKARSKNGGLGSEDRYQKVNREALENLSAWVPLIFPDAVEARGGYRVTSQMLGRNLEEDLSLMPEGIVDFGIADQGDAREGKKTAINVVMEFGKKDFNAAFRWLRQALWGKVVITVRGGELTDIADMAEEALLSFGFPIFQRSGELVMPERGKQKDDVIRRSDEATTLFPINPEWLVQMMGEAAEWNKVVVKKKGEETIICDPPTKYAMAILGRPPSKWKFPKLLGVINTPTLSRTGEIIEEPGYHPETELLLDFKKGAFPKIPEEPTREEALEALEKLNRPMRGFPFDGEGDGVSVSASRSVALSAMLSALIRPSLRTTPMHGYDAPTAGSGKSILAESPSLLANGTKPASMSQGKTPEEDEKRLSTVLHAGDTVILIDNCQHQVTGDFLCSMLTQEKVQARILGQSERRVLPCTSLVVCTGNNLTFAGDVTRRSVRCMIDAKQERPDQREFNFDFQEEILANRSELVVAGLTVLRAYVVAGRPGKLKPMGSFDDWMWVRGALVWLGQKDPAETREQILESDPRRAELADALNLWEKAYGTRPVTLSEIGQANGHEGERTSLRTMLTEISGKPFWNAKSIGWWLRRNSKRYVNGKCIAQSGGIRTGAFWMICLQNQIDTAKNEPKTVEEFPF